jgi:NADH dehydrogenase
MLAEVTGVDVASRTIEAAAGGVGVRKIAFYYLVVATGMRPSYFGHDEFMQYAPGLKSLGDAETIRAKILGAFEVAATSNDEAERARQMAFVLVGAGPTGVELAASLACSGLATEQCSLSAKALSFWSVWRPLPG